MTHDEALAIKKRAEKATPEPWIPRRGFNDLGEPSCYYGVDAPGDAVFLAEGWCEAADADFIAHARSDVPALADAYIEAMDALARMVHCAINSCSSCEHKREDAEVCNSKFRSARTLVEAGKKGKP